MISKKTPDRQDPLAPPSNRAPSIRDVARAAGVHSTTVSLALRNSPRLPEKTRSRIRAIADQLGYRPSPLVAAFIQRRRLLGSDRFQGNLAFIIRSGKKGSRRNFEQYTKALSLRAGELGFKLDTFDLAEYGDEPRKLEKVLHARGIFGLILAPFPGSHNTLDFSWEHFAVVNLSASLVSPLVDRVEFNHYEGSRLAVQKCEERGYRRVGYLSLTVTDIRTLGRWQGGFLTHIPATKGFKILPPLITTQKEFEAVLAKWLLRHSPDALLGNRSVLAKAVKTIHAMKRKVGSDIGIVDLNIHRLPSHHAGIHTSRDISCKVAIDVVAGKLYRNEFGIPQIPQTILLPPIWHDGTTLPFRRTT